MNLYDFAVVSNALEGITSDASNVIHTGALERFYNIRKLTVNELFMFAKDLKGDIRLRSDFEPLIVFGRSIDFNLTGFKTILKLANNNEISSWSLHNKTYVMQPFDDISVNARVARALWLWHEFKFSNGVQNFLERYYIQTLRQESASFEE